MTLSQSEIEERAAVLRRFREALLRQRERFSRYLRKLESEPFDGTMDMEKAIVREIGRFERAIEPLEVMYREYDPAGAAEIPKLRDALERTRTEVVRRTETSRDLLRQQVDSLRTEISSLRVIRRNRALFDVPQPSTIDISA